MRFERGTSDVKASVLTSPKPNYTTDSRFALNNKTI